MHRGRPSSAPLIDTATSLVELENLAGLQAETPSDHCRDRDLAFGRQRGFHV
jgi:hypothetical protein